MVKSITNDASWGDVCEGDIVTCEYGTLGASGYFVHTARAIMSDGALSLEGAKMLNLPNLSIEYLERMGLEIVSIEHELLPEHEGVLTLTDEGTALSNGDVDTPWMASWGGEHNTPALSNPVEALPVPAKELRELMKYLKMRDYLPAELTNFITTTRREWERAGINENDDRGE